MGIRRDALLVGMPSAAMLILLLFSVLDQTLGAAKPLPSFIKACARNDPEMNKCATEYAKLAVPFMKNGIPEYGVSVLDPHVIKEVKFDRKALGMDMVMRNVRLTGLGDSAVKNIEIEMNPPYFKWNLVSPKLELVGKYEANGRILLLPIQGKGNINITLTNVDYIYSFKSGIVKKSDGLEYLVPKPSSIDYQHGRAYIRLENLFNGNKLLGEEMNRFLDENWRYVTDQLGPPIAQAIALAMQTMVENLTSRVPYDQIFPEKV